MLMQEQHEDTNLNLIEKKNNILIFRINILIIVVF